MLHMARQLDVDLPMLQALLPSNRQQIEHAIDLVRKIGKKRIGVLGLSFKAGTDDLRESPIVLLIETLIGKGYKISIYDEEVSLARLVGANKRYIEQMIPHVSSLMVGSPEDVIQQSEVIVVGKKTEDFQRAVAGINQDKVVIDLVRLWPDLTCKPVNYEGISW